MPLALPSEPNTQAPQGTAHRLLTSQRSTHFAGVTGNVTIAELVPCRSSRTCNADELAL